MFFARKKELARKVTDVVRSELSRDSARLVSLASANRSLATVSGETSDPIRADRSYHSLPLFAAATQIFSAAKSEEAREENKAAARIVHDSETFHWVESK